MTINKEVKVLMELESFTKVCVFGVGGVTAAGKKTAVRISGLLIKDNF